MISFSGDESLSVMVDRTSKVLGLTVLCAVVFHFGWCPATATAQATMSLERGIRKQVA